MMIMIFYDLLLLIPLAAATVSWCAPFFGAQTPGYIRIIAAIAVAVYFVLVRRLALREKIMLLGLAATVILAFIFYHPKGERLSFITKYRWIGALALITLLCMILCILSEKIIHLRTVAAAVLVVLSVISLFKGRDPGKAAMIFEALFILIMIIDLLQYGSNKEGDPDRIKHLVFTSGFFLVIFIALSFVKIPSKPYDWGFVRSVSTFVSSTAARIGDMFADKGWDSDEPLIGFSDRGGLGGNIIKGSGYTVLDLRTSTGYDSALYLAGKTFDGFDGQSWTSSEDEALLDPCYDTLETIAAVIDGKGDVPLSDLIKASDLTTEDKSVHGMHRFDPPKTVSYSVTGSSTSHTCYYRINRRSPEFTKIINGALPVTPEGWEAAKLECGLENVSCDLSGLDEQRTLIRRLYLPETDISAGARKTVDELLDGSESDYEKLSRIEGMLRKYNYTDRPGNMPVDSITSAKDFLDWFMFEKKEGYCSYYASAFVILARAYGIPARYVQGYRIDTDEKLHTTVSSSDAHAWAEAYIDNIGWLIFEPTAGIGNVNRSAGWRTSAGSVQNESYFDPEHMKDIPDDADVPDGTGPAAHTPIRWSRIVLPAACGILFTLMLFGLDMLLKKRRYARLSMRDKVLWQCRRGLQILKRKGLARSQSETLSEYRERATGAVPSMNAEFLDVYEQILYADTDITVRELAMLEEQIKTLKNCPKTI